LDDLRQAAQKHRIRRLAGFGAKTEEKILEALSGREDTSRRFLLAEAKVFADAVVSHLKQTPGSARLTPQVVSVAARRPWVTWTSWSRARSPGRSWTVWRTTKPLRCQALIQVVDSVDGCLCHV